jgi:hypothetical protein
MTTNNYELGQQVRFTVQFTDENDDPANPTQTRFFTLSPTGTETAYTYPTDDEITLLGLGNFEALFEPDTVGLWRVRWEGTGAVDAVFSDAIYVVSRFDELYDTFVDVPTLAQYLETDIDEADPFALFALGAATEAIRKYTDQHISYVADDEITLDGSGTDILLLPELPVHEVSSVEKWESDDFTAVDSTDYTFRLNGAGMLVRRSGEWGFGRQGVKVTYTHGYERIPADIRMICTVMAGRAYSQAGEESEGIGQGFNTTYAGQPGVFTKEEERILSKYRRRH